MLKDRKARNFECARFESRDTICSRHLHALTTHWELHKQFFETLRPNSPHAPNPIPAAPTIKSSAPLHDFLKPVLCCTADFFQLLPIGCGSPSVFICGAWAASSRTQPSWLGCAVSPSRRSIRGLAAPCLPPFLGLPDPPKIACMLHARPTASCVALRP